MEDSGVGTALATELRDVGRPVIAVKPQGSKLTRMSVQCGKFAERLEVRVSFAGLWGWISELSDNGYLGNDPYGQWVTRTVGSVEKCQNENSQSACQRTTTIS